MIYRFDSLSLSLQKLDAIEMEDDKKAMLRREIDQFRNTYKVNLSPVLPKSHNGWWLARLASETISVMENGMCFYYFCWVSMISLQGHW